MCRSIKQLRLAERPATDEEIYAAALHYIRKVSGLRAPSRANQAAFDQAGDQVAAATRECLAQLPAPKPAVHVIYTVQKV